MDLVHHNARALESGVVCNKHLHFQKTLEACEKSSLHHDCTIMTRPCRFNPKSCYDCCIAYIHELTAEAPYEMFVVRMQKEGAQEKKNRSFKQQMNES
jgi:hypothetical protein